jgi:hypothetical protein
MMRKVRNKEHLQANLSFLSNENLGYRLASYDTVDVVSAAPVPSILKKYQVRRCVDVNWTTLAHDAIKSIVSSSGSDEL